MQRNAMAAQVRSSGAAIAKATVRSMYEFLRALTTLFVGGLFMFYSYVTAVGTIQSAQAELLVEAVLMFVMFIVATGATVYFIGIINGVIENPLFEY
jgi:cytochrome b subunit of formate dehydrogenase